MPCRPGRRLGRPSPRLYYPEPYDFWPLEAVSYHLSWAATIQGNPKKSNGNPRQSKEIQRNPMNSKHMQGNLNIFKEIQGNPNKSKEIQRNPGISKEIKKSKEIKGIPMKSKETHGNRIEWSLQVAHVRVADATVLSTMLHPPVAHASRLLPLSCRACATIARTTITLIVHMHFARVSGGGGF